MKSVPQWRIHRQFIAIGISDAIAYRGAFLLGILTSLIPLATSLLLWSAIYRAGGAGMQIAGFDLNAMLSYFLVTTALRMSGLAQDSQWEITDQVRNGRLSNFLLRPINYVVMHWDLRMTSIVIGVALASIPIGVVLAAAHSVLVYPAAGWRWAAFALSVLLGIQISFLLSVCVGLTAFWFLETSGVMWAIMPIQMVLSGALFPLELVPGWLFRLLKFLPWTYETYFPLQIFLGRVEPAAIAQGVALQVFWVAMLCAAVALVWRRGTLRYEAVGG